MSISIPRTPAHAVILAAGLGFRRRTLIGQRPKPLVRVHGVPVLHNALRALAGIGVEAATIVVGYRKESVRSACGSRFAGIDLRYVESATVDRTGSAYSLWLAREALLQGEVVLLDGNVFFEAALLDRLIGSAAGDVTAVARFDATMSGSAATISADGAIHHMLMERTAADLGRGDRLYKTINLFRFTAETLRRELVPALDEAVGSGALTAHVEHVLTYLAGERGLRLAAADCSDLNWAVIDSEADLHMAEAIFAAEPLTRRRAVH
jgi:choline kinase